MCAANLYDKPLVTAEILATLSRCDGYNDRGLRAKRSEFGRSVRAVLSNEVRLLEAVFSVPPLIRPLYHDDATGTTGL